MVVLMLNQFCCGCSLKTGSIIIGTLDTIFASIYFTASIFTAAAASIAAGDLPEEADTWNSIEGVYIAYAVFASFLCLATGCLNVGAANENPVLLLPWIIYACVAALINVILSIVNAASYFRVSGTSNGVGILLGGLIGTCLQIYFILVVYSLYRKLKCSGSSLPR